MIVLDIEQLVTWALREQGLGWDSVGGGTLLGRFAALGTMVSGGMVADPSVALLSDTDAIVVRQAIDGLEREERMLVLTHGRAGTRPEWCPEGEGEPEPLLGANGRPGRGLDMLAWSKRCETVRYERGQWAAWRFALLKVGAAVNGRMASHQATGPAVVARPWEDAAMLAAAAAEAARFEAGRGAGAVGARGVAADPALAGLTLDELRAEAQAEVRERATVFTAGVLEVEPRRPRRVRGESTGDAGDGP